MLVFETVIPGGAEGQEAQEVLRLPFARRDRSRQRLVLPSGREAGLCLPRGAVLRHGDLLVSTEGVRVRVEADDERLSRVGFANARDLARACCHLGNRHAPMQIGPDWVQYLEDRVLDEVMAGLGFGVEHLLGPFEPEPGACPLPHLEVRGFNRGLKP
jgi:urease accessory protein